MNKKTITETAITSVILITLFAVLLICGDKALDALEQVECYRLQKQAEDYKNFLYSHNNPGGFYVTKQDKQMCLDLGIEIKAPVK